MVRPGAIAIERVLNRHYNDAYQQLGVLLRVYDYTEDPRHGWLPCPLNRTCHSATKRDRWTGSFLYKGMPFKNKENNIPIFADGIRGGILYNRSFVHIRCMYGEDGNTRYKHNGCEPQCPHSQSIDCRNRSFNETSFRRALSMTSNRTRRQYNEVVMDSNMSFPDAVVGFFYPVDDHGSCCRRSGTSVRCHPQGDCRQIARDAASRFSDVYGVVDVGVFRLFLNRTTDPFQADSRRPPPSSVYANHRSSGASAGSTWTR